jgi:antitoxin (DNA-binding transcriptional repressor) of toxin-antitoxin stability system
MKRYTVAQARERLADVLDEAERGGTVIIERRNVQYVIQARRPARKPRVRQSIIETLDPAVDSGQWHWNLTASGVRFTRPRRRT